MFTYDAIKLMCAEWKEYKEKGKIEYYDDELMMMDSCCESLFSMVLETAFMTFLILPIAIAIDILLLPFEIIVFCVKKFYIDK